jgi:hypothetical protein
MKEILASALWIYGLAAVVSMLIAALIKLVVVLLGRAARHAAPADAAPLLEPNPGIAAVVQLDAHDVAAITAAVYASIGVHRIVHIEDAAHGSGWAAEGRLAHHASHRLPTRRPDR